jgi:HAMP domain-containing protein
LSALLALGLGAAGVNMLASGIRKRRAKKELAELEANPISPYAVTPEMQQYYSQALGESRNPMGVSPAERLAFNQNLAKQTNTQFNNAISIGGGNAARSIRGALNAASLGQINQFASFDAGLRRSNRQSALSRLGMATNQYQNIRTMNDQANIQAQGALGNAMRIQDENIARGLSSISDFALTAYGYEQGWGQDNANKEPNGGGGGLLGTFDNWQNSRRVRRMERTPRWYGTSTGRIQ